MLKNKILNHRLNREYVSITVNLRQLGGIDVFPRVEHYWNTLEFDNNIKIVNSLTTVI